jgi:quinoprotein glucose dehydrogenase
MINMSSGPSGLVYYPGTGFSKEYDNHFFLCDFRGAPANSGIWSFSFKKDGAGFSMQNPKQFLWSILATDVDFGPDGSMYVSDWVNGWNKPGKGRIYKLSDEKESSSTITKEVKTLLGEGFENRSDNELVKLLEHVDLRVRRESQFALAAKGSSSITKFASVAKGESSLFSKMHAIWGLGQIGRKDDASVIPVLLPLLEDKDPEIRAQSAKVLGELRAKEARKPLLAMLNDSEPRAQFFASQALVKLPSIENLPGLIALLDKNQNKDVYIRHGCVVALAAINDAKALAGYSKNSSLGIRMGTTLALRQLESEEISNFLTDTNQEIADEAARAIYDIPITKSLNDLAKTITVGNTKTTHNLRRVLAANRRIGTKQNALEIAKLAASPQTPVEIRMEALEHLEKWGDEAKRDFVTGLARPTQAANKADAIIALKTNLPALLGAETKISKETIRVAASLKIDEIIPELIASLKNNSLDGKFRADSLKALTSLKAPEIKSLTETALTDSSDLVRAEAIRIYSKIEPTYAEKTADTILKKGSLKEQQALIGILGESKSTLSKSKLKSLVQEAISGKTPPGIMLEIGEAGLKAGVEDSKSLIQEDITKPNPMAFALEGGDKEAGKTIFFQKIAVACLRCHKLEGQGGDVGPELNGIGGKQKRDYLLESIILPEKNIAKGFESLIIVLSNGKTVTGILKQDKPNEIVLMDFEGKLMTVKKADIEEKKIGKSAMPADLYKQLSKQELRDLVEYLASLKQ